MTTAWDVFCLIVFTCWESLSDQAVTTEQFVNLSRRLLIIFATGVATEGMHSVEF